jgi:hypothetical protein
MGALPWNITVDATSVYWTTDTADALMKVPITGGTPVTLAVSGDGPHRRYRRGRDECLLRDCRRLHHEGAPGGRCAHDARAGERLPWVPRLRRRGGGNRRGFDERLLDERDAGWRKLLREEDAEIARPRVIKSSFSPDEPIPARSVTTLLNSQDGLQPTRCPTIIR